MQTRESKPNFYRNESLSHRFCTQTWRNFQLMPNALYFQSIMHKQQVYREKNWPENSKVMQSRSWILIFLLLGETSLDLTFKTS